MTSRFRRSVLASLATLTLVLGLTAGPALGKDGMWEARLDAPISRDAAAGTEITVGWTVSQVSGTDRLPFEPSGAVFLRLYPLTRGADTTEVVGTEEPAGSDHFIGTIVVPAGGVARIESGLINESCAGGTCTRWDMLFQLVGEVLVFGPGIGAPAVSPADPATAPAAGRVSAAPAGPGWVLPALVVLAAVVVAAVVLALAARAGGRTRPSDGGAVRSD
jgi:hypothetical protein